MKYWFRHFRTLRRFSHFIRDHFIGTPMKLFFWFSMSFSSCSTHSSTYKSSKPLSYFWFSFLRYMQCHLTFISNARKTFPLFQFLELILHLPESFHKTTWTPAPLNYVCQKTFNHISNGNHSTAAWKLFWQSEMHGMSSTSLSLVELYSTCMSASNARCADHLCTTDKAICNHSSHSSLILEPFPHESWMSNWISWNSYKKAGIPKSILCNRNAEFEKKQQEHNCYSKPRMSTKNGQNGKEPAPSHKESIMSPIISNISTVKSIIFGLIPIL